MKIVLTDELIARLRPTEKNQPFPDGKQTGLVLRITPADTRTWFAVKRPKGAKDPVWKKIGEWPEMRVRAARRAVLPALAEIGKVPATKEEDDSGEPWEVMAERYISYLHRLDRHGKPVVRSAHPLESLIRRFLIPPWRGVPGRQITREMTIDVLVAHKEVRPNPLAGKQCEKRTIGGPFACRNLHSVAHAMFGWLADPPVDISRSRFIPANPVPSDGEKIHGLTADDRKRDVWLDREVQARGSMAGCRGDDGGQRAGQWPLWALDAGGARRGATAFPIRQTTP